MEVIALLIVIVLFLVKIGIMYWLVPLILMNVFLFMGVHISFLMCVGICFLVYMLGSVFRK